MYTNQDTSTADRLCVQAWNFWEYLKVQGFNFWMWLSQKLRLEVFSWIPIQVLHSGGTNLESKWFWNCFYMASVKKGHICYSMFLHQVLVSQIYQIIVLYSPPGLYNIYYDLRVIKICLQAEVSRHWIKIFFFFPILFYFPLCMAHCAVICKPWMP